MIKKTDYIEELLEKYDGIAAYLTRKGMVCVQCGEPVWGTLEESVEGKNIDIDGLVADLNEHFGTSN